MENGSEEFSGKPQELESLHETLLDGNAIRKVKQNLQQIPLKETTLEMTRDAMRMFLIDFSPNETRDMLTSDWDGEVVLVRPEVTQEVARETRRIVGVLQNSTADLVRGDLTKFNALIIDELIDGCREKARTARVVGDSELAVSIDAELERYRDLRGLLIREVSPPIPKERGEKLVLPKLPDLEPPKTGTMREYLGNLNTLRNYVEQHYGEVLPFDTLKGEHRDNYVQLLSRQKLPEDTLIFFDHEEIAAGHPRGWVQSNDLSEEVLVSDPDAKERVVRDLMRSAKPRNLSLKPEDIQFGS